MTRMQIALCQAVFHEREYTKLSRRAQEGVRTWLARELYKLEPNVSINEHNKVCPMPVSGDYGCSAATSVPSSR